MSEEEAQGAGSNGGTNGNTTTNGQPIPKIEPRVFVKDEISGKLAVFRDSRPVKSVEHPAPRTGLLVNGIDFQKVNHLDPTKLKTKDGVKLRVQALGRPWSQLKEEMNLQLFEKANFQTPQDGKAEVKDLRDYIMVKHSTRTMEDHKKIIMGSHGSLTNDCNYINHEVEALKTEEGDHGRWDKE
ncbi:CCHC-type domain-containing protein [Durusdinium trenchii]|uniref:CCHC-type domain-containing protein n=1 Tax=Durusdinium trenchii TaxID=1381693 RepID=A0ABP0HN92_9DINO